MSFAVSIPLKYAFDKLRSSLILFVLFLAFSLGASVPAAQATTSFDPNPYFSTDSGTPTDLTVNCSVSNPVNTPPVAIIVNLNGDVLTEPELLQYTLSYKIDGGSAVPLTYDSHTHNSGGLSDILFNGTMDCTPYKDGLTHTFEITVVDHNATPYSENFYFRHPVEGVPVLTFTNVDQAGDNELAISSVPFEIQGNASVVNDTISAFSIQIDGQVLNISNLGDGNFDSAIEYFNTGSLTRYNGTYPVIFGATALNSNVTTSHTFSLVVNAPGNDAPAVPNVDLINAINDEITSNDSTILDGVASMSAGLDTITAVRYTVPGVITNALATPTDGAFDQTDEYFTIDTGALALGSSTYTLTISAETNVGGTAQHVYTVNPVVPPSETVAPTCGTTWYNQTSPAYTNVFTYSGLTCTDDSGIASAKYRIYHYIDGNLTNPGGDGFISIPTPATGSYGDTSVGLGFTATVPTDVNHDGALDIELVVVDGAGNSFTYVDPMVVDYQDQTEPALSLQLVRPDPISDDTPTITGTCSDVTSRETNTAIASIDINIDGDGWTSVSALDGTFNASSERFSYTLPSLANGTHQVDVRCTDVAGNTKTTSSEEDIDFSVQDQIIGAPAEITNFSEDFNSHVYQDLADSTLVWGNGKLRLREDLVATRSAVDTVGFGDRYARNSDGNNYILTEAVDPQYAWYIKAGALGKLDKATDTVSAFNPADYGTSFSGTLTDVKEVTYGGKNYLLVSDAGGLVVINLTDSTGSRDSSHGHVGLITPDLGRSRFGLYVNPQSVGAGEMKVAYWQLDSGVDPFASDVFTIMPENTASIVGTDVVRVFASPVANEYYISIYSAGFFRFNDNNTPTTFADDQAVRIDDPTTIGNDFDQVFALTFDPSNHLIFGTSGSENGELFVMTSDGGTAYDTTDDTIVKLATARELGYNDVFGLKYLAGANDVGDQIFIETENNNPIYLNYNSTYSDLVDDTRIELIVNAGIRPSVSRILISDYNTLYVDNDRQGLYKVYLNRNWQASGQAVALPPRPSNATVIDNVLADAVTSTPISLLPADGTPQLAARSWMPQAYADGEPTITYEVSTNDGATWQAVTLGELQALAITDYRLQFRITMAQSNGQSPVVNQYSLQYGGYPDPAQIGVVDHFEVSVSPSSFAAGSTFGLTVTAKDVLGFTVTDYNSAATLSLFTAASENVSSRLNLSSITLTNGVGTTNGAVVTQAGTYTVKATEGSVENQSSQFTVAASASVVPTLTFTSNNYSPRPGELFTLRWTTTNMNEAGLDGQTVDTTSYKTLAVSKDTTFRLSAQGAYGALSATVTITVDPTNSIAPTVQATPAPAASVRPSSGDQTGGSLSLAEIEAEIVDASSSPALSNSNQKKPKPTLSVSGDMTVLEGEKVKVWWQTQNATSVTVDYLGGGVGKAGEFEFFGKTSQKITITAFNGDEKVTKTVMITVKNLPAVLGKILPESAQQVVAFAVRYSTWTWVILLSFITLFPFYKRRSKPLEKVSWWRKLLRWLGLTLWVVSPLIILANILALTSLGGTWRLAVSAICLAVMVKHAMSWYKESHPHK